MKILSALHLQSDNPGASTGADWWSSHKSASAIESFNPTNGKLIATVQRANHDDYEQVIRQAEKTFRSWRQVPAPKRGEIIRQIGDELRRQKSALGDLVALEMGKSKQEGDGEVQEMIDMADLAVGQSRMLYGKSMHSEREQHRMMEQWHPIGVVGIISAFNFPVAVWAWNAFVAAICGNTCVWRPSPKTPLCAVAVQHICNEVMQRNQLSGVFNLLVTDDLALSRALVDDKRIALLSFTGSSKVGAEIHQQVAKRFGRCLLECSGNNAVIVDETANLSLALPAVVFGAVGTAGQRCTTTRRLFLHESIANKFITSLVDAYRKVRIGDPLDTNQHMGPLIDQQAVTGFMNAVESAHERGGEILFGGKALTREGYFVEPTIIRAEHDWDIVHEETFAPILYVMTYRDLSEAIMMQNAVSQGLSSAIFTQNVLHAEQFLSAQGSDCGIANVNIGTSGAEIGGAFGGEKTTGGGREAGSDAWQYYMRRQTNTINWSSQLPLAQGIKFQL